MKKMVTLLLAGALLLGFAACGGAATETLTGTPKEVLTQLKAAAAQNGERPSFDEEITAENAQGDLGLTAEQFAQYADSAYKSANLIMTSAETTAVVKCKDSKAAAAAKALIASGFDPKKWICVLPEQCLVAQAGSYLLLAVGKKEKTDALLAAFTSLAGDAASQVFYSGEAAGEDDGVSFAPPMLDAPPETADASGAAELG